MTCIRTAWLEHAGNTILLEDASRGYYCTNLDLGYPEVREVVNNRPDQHGVDDRTQFFGSRAVSAEIIATDDIDDIASSFAPYMVPNIRPVLHYILDRPGAAERTLVLRAASYSWPIQGPTQRDIKLQWVAADPIVRDPVQRTAVARSGSSGITPGRQYNLTFPRTYPPGGGTPTAAIIRSEGDVPIRPLLRIYGPITAPVVSFRTPDGRTFQVGFLPSFTVGVGAWVDVDTEHKTAYYESDMHQNVLTSLDWVNLNWPVLPPNANNAMTLRGQGTMTDVTQVQAIWHDGYLT